MEILLFQRENYISFWRLIPVFLYNGLQGSKTGNIYYSFYALHLLVFGIIKQLLK